MKNIQRWFAPLCLLALLTGCASTPPAVTQATVRTAVQLGVTFGVDQSPEAIPYLRYAAPVVCEAAKGTNVSPEFVIERLQNNAQAEQFKNPQAILIFNSAFGIYSGLYETYGAGGVQEQTWLRAWLTGTCEGMLLGLPPVIAPGVTSAKPVVRARLR